MQCAIVIVSLGPLPIGLRSRGDSGSDLSVISSLRASIAEVMYG